MSRAANVTLTFTGDLSTVEQQYEAFVRKVQQPIKVPLSAEGVGAGGNTTTTFANGTVPGATPGVGGATPALQLAVERLTSTINDMNRANEARGGRGGGGDGGSGGGGGGGGGGEARIRRAAINLAATSAGSNAERAQIYRDAAENTEDTAERFGLLSRAVRAERAGDGGGRARPIFGLGRLQRFATAGFLLNEGVQVAKSYQAEGIEERLAVGRDGSTDLRRQFAAQTGFADKVEGSNIGSQLGGIIREYITGDREAAQRTLDDSTKQDRAMGLRQQGIDYIRTSKERDYITAGDGERLRATRTAQVENVRATREATNLHNEQVNANAKQDNYDTTGPDAFLAVAKREIGRGYDQTLKDIAKQYQPVFNRLSAELPALAQEHLGNFRAADEIRKRADVAQSIEGELDPASRILKQAAGESFISNYLSRRGINEALVGSELSDLTLSFGREATGDERGALVARQRARRTGALGPESDDPNRAGRGRTADAQSTAELRAYDLSQSYVSQGIDAGERVSALLAQRRPIGAEAESIYSRGTASAERSVDEGKDQNAIGQYRTTRNQLEALRNEILLGGQGVQVSAGAYGPGGTEGSGQENVIKALTDIGAKLDKLDSSINALSQD